MGLQAEKNEKSLKGYIHGNCVGRFAFLKDFSIFSLENCSLGLLTQGCSLGVTVLPCGSRPDTFACLSVIGGGVEKKWEFDIYEIKSMAIITPSFPNVLTAYEKSGQGKAHRCVTPLLSLLGDSRWQMDEVQGP